MSTDFLLSKENLGEYLSELGKQFRKLYIRYEVERRDDLSDF